MDYSHRQVVCTITPPHSNRKDIVHGRRTHRPSNDPTVSTVPIVPNRSSFSVPMSQLSHVPYNPKSQLSHVAYVPNLGSCSLFVRSCDIHGNPFTSVRSTSRSLSKCNLGHPSPCTQSDKEPMSQMSPLPPSALIFEGTRYIESLRLSMSLGQKNELLCFLFLHP